MSDNKLLPSLGTTDVVRDLPVLRPAMIPRTRSRSRVSMADSRTLLYRHLDRRSCKPLSCFILIRTSADLATGAERVAIG